MRVVILGTRGIPGHYGGFEKCAEHIAVGLVEKGHEVIVYNSHNHPNQQLEWNNVKIVHVNDPEYKMGTFGRLVYDYIKNLKKQQCDVVLQLGYRSGPIWDWTIPKSIVLTINMGGLEWKRPKYGSIKSKLVLLAERMAVRNCNFLISDSIGIQNYLLKKFDKSSTYIPYGAYVFANPAENIVAKYKVTKYKYDLFIGSLEPENSLEMILDGVVASKVNRIFLVVGNHLTGYGKFLKEKYGENPQIKFLGGIYELNDLNNLRYFPNLYFHGHTVVLGGTNPLLLEAMACNSLISANNNEFNKHILGDDALYFESALEIADQMKAVRKTDQLYNQILDNNILKITETYNWKYIVDMYEEYFCGIVASKEYKVKEISHLLTEQ